MPNLSPEAQAFEQEKQERAQFEAKNWGHRSKAVAIEQQKQVVRGLEQQLAAAKYVLYELTHDG